MEDPSYSFLIISITLAFSFFFSGIEIAFVNSDKLHIAVQDRAESVTGKILSYFHKNESLFLATMLVGNNIALVLYGIYTAELLTPYVTEQCHFFLDTENSLLTLVIQSILSTLLVLVVAEFLPKNIFLLNPEFLLKIFSIPTFGIYVLLYPLVFVIVRISKKIISVLGGDISEKNPVFGYTDLNNYVKKIIPNIDDSEESEIDAKILSNALEFKTLRARDCMIPRTEIIGVEINEDISALRKAFVESGHSKIIIYKETIDDIIGYCMSIELFKKPKEIKSILTPIMIVPETLLLKKLLIKLIAERKSLALVVDEYGGTSGISSTEDVIEEIFGEIKDEHDDEDLIEQKIGDNVFVFSARHEIDYLNEHYDLKLPEGDYDTVGGLIFTVHEDVPRINETIEIEEYIITVLSMDENRIDKVRVTIRK